MLEETGKFLEIYKLPILDQEETDNVNRLIMYSEIEFMIIIIIITFSKQSPRPDSFTGEF